MSQLASSSLQQLLKLAQHEPLLQVQGVRGASLCFVAASLAHTTPGPLLIITPTPELAEQLLRELPLFLQTGGAPLRALPYPAWDVDPYEGLSPHADIAQDRLKALHLLLHEPQRLLVVAPAVALLKRVLPRPVFVAHTLHLRQGQELTRESLLKHLTELGYLVTDVVQEPGFVAVRGDIVDVFSPLHPLPVRLEFFGDELESIRAYDLETQRSVKPLDALQLPPVREELLTDETLEMATGKLKVLSDQLEKPAHIRRQLLEDMRQGITFPGLEHLLGMLYPKLDLLTDYLPAQTRVMMVEPARIEQQWHTHRERLDGLHRAHERRERLMPPPETLFVQPDELTAALSSFSRLLCLEQISLEHAHLPRVQLKLEPTRGLRQSLLSEATEAEGLLKPLVDRLLTWRKEEVAAFVVCHTEVQLKRLRELLQPYRVSLPDVSFDVTLKTLLNPFADSRALLRPLLGHLSEGFRFPEGRLVLLAEEDLFGPKLQTSSQQRKKLKNVISSFSQLNKGDPVVHATHGVGIFRGLIRLNLTGVESDFLHLEYADGDKLYLPAHRANALQKYTGQGDGAPKLDKMGGVSFSKTRAKVQESLLKVAHQLLELYAARQVLQGHAFPVDRQALDAFEATFPYQETDDQLSAIEAVYQDMASERPMDRLVCGDVGYGKTEVAIRAAFVAAHAGKQVAVLVPTTILALQHYRSILERFRGWPLNVAQLHRFTSPKEQREVLEKLKRGVIDVVVGTHRLLAQDVVFKDLGLLIVDEEHRFGVSHKERIKNLRKNLDVLTMTATPIPRTLHMAMSGLKDFSLITTPPRDRHAVRTWQVEFSPSMIQEAIRNELSRGGQVYFVHNRVQSIDSMQKLLNKLVPEARVGVAHGQLDERTLEQKMVDFIEKRIDILLCTSIVESGLDIPAANTIFINRADRFGLAQLYQLRGRVGRSSERSYCYLLTPANARLPEVAERRLQTLVNLTELGGGFKVASEDLEIRGAGDLLGTSQSGNINAVGFDMYCELLDRAVRELQGQELVDELEPDIDLKEPAFFPTEYVPDLHARLHYYKLLSDAQDELSLKERMDELEDRFGSPPEVVKNLYRLMEIRLTLKMQRIRGLSRSGERVVLRLDERCRIDRARLVQLLVREAKRYKLTPDQRLTVHLTAAELKDVVRSVKILLRSLQ